MTFRRKVYDKLLQWKKCNGTEALLIEGAPSVGKSTVVKEFADREYRSSIIIDFSVSSEATNTAKELLEHYLDDPDTLFLLLSSAYKTRLYLRESLIVFDEVQRFPRARECIKHLVKDGRYDYIETGSLVSIKKNIKSILIPSEERVLKMYPMDFEEFCWALGHEPISLCIRDCFTKRIPMDPGIDRRATLLFREYMLVGGMPQAVAAYTGSGKNMDEADGVKKEILDLYQTHIDRLSGSSKVASIYQNLPSALSSPNDRLKYTDLCKGTYSRDYADAFFWLADSMMCNISQSCARPDSPSHADDERNFVKLYMGDTGLLASRLFGDGEKLESGFYDEILNGRHPDCEVTLYKNAVAQMLASSGYSLYFYYHYSKERHRNDIEIDFMTTEYDGLGRKVRPIAVKSSPVYRTTSLDRFKERFRDIISESIVIQPNNLFIKDGTLYIPPYMTFCL